MKYIAVIETDDYENFEFFEDATGKYLAVKDANAKYEEVMALQFKEAPICRNCNWWKDSDGKFRRGIGAESQCPINRKEVYDGNGYCFLYEARR